MIRQFTNQQNAAILKCGNPHINFGGGVTALIGEKLRDPHFGGNGRAGTHHFRGNFAQFVIALDIETIPAVGEARL